MIRTGKDQPRSSFFWAVVGFALAASGLAFAGGVPLSREVAPPADGKAPHRARFVVALDPGHGGSNLGAHGPWSRLYEKDVTLLLAERVRELVSSKSRPAEPSPTSPPIVEVVLCRERDVLVPIRARARCASDAGAQLFVSLHTNAVPAHKERGSARGFDVFVLDSDAVAEDAAIAADDVDAPVLKAAAAHRTWVVARLSREAAAVVRRHLGAALGLAADRGLREGGALLDVLRGTMTPSLLAEVGFLDHPEEGARLGTADGREPIARALADAFQELAAVAQRRASRQAPGALTVEP
jgi:N-acetylmuramoyl-L-alanine amidase